MSTIAISSMHARASKMGKRRSAFFLFLVYVEGVLYNINYKIKHRKKARSEYDWAEYEAKARSEYNARRVSLDARHLRSATRGGFKLPPHRKPTLATTNKTSGSTSHVADDVGGAPEGCGGAEAPWHYREKQVLVCTGNWYYKKATR